jgi:hypothetical protein
MRRLIKAACLLALLIAPLAVSAAGSLPSGPCRMIDPSTCPNTKELVRASGFAQALGHFSGNLKVGYFKSNSSLSEQALAALGGESEHVVPLGDKRYLFSACPPHDCKGDAAAVVVNEYGQIEALGISSFHCGASCEDVRHLDFYIKTDAQDDALLAALKAWGTSDNIHKALWHPEADDGIAARTEVHLLP